jgi:predicted transcriptional regulator
MDAVGPLQIRVLHFLWRQGPATVQLVLDHLNAENSAKKQRILAYTTVLTVMRNLSRRKILAQEATGRAHRFSPLIEREAYQRAILAQVRNDLFNGDAQLLLACLAGDESLPADLRTQLQPLVVG